MNAQPAFDILPHLQSNYAFTKAYVAESSGTKGGLPGCNLFIDSNLFNMGAVGENNMSLGKAIDWNDKNTGVKAVFHTVSSMTDRKFDSIAPSFFRNGIEVAIGLTSDPDVLSKLREAKWP